MVAEPVRETGDPRRVVELREQTRRQKSRSGDVLDHQEDHLEKINLEKINHETEYIKISQSQYTDKAQKDSEKGTQQVDLSWTSDTVNMQVDV